MNKDESWWSIAWDNKCNMLELEQSNSHDKGTRGGEKLLPRLRRKGNFIKRTF